MDYKLISAIMSPVAVQMNWTNCYRFSRPLQWDAEALTSQTWQSKPLKPDNLQSISAEASQTSQFAANICRKLTAPAACIQYQPNVS